MGFPKPWPTEWPHPEDPRSQPDPDTDTQRPDEWEDEPPREIPEFRQQFSSVTWAVNHACNLRCTHCYDVVPHRRMDLSTSDALRVVDRLKDVGVTFIAFSGGEAFLRKDLLRLMEHCKNHRIRFGARSNGTLISAELAARLRALGIAVVGVSFDGATRETHDAVRGKGAFDASLSGLKALVEAGIRTQIEVVLSRQNEHEALAFIKLGELVGASEVNFSAITPHGRAINRMADALDNNLWLRLTEVLQRASRTSSVPVTPNCAFAGPCVANIEPHITCDAWLTPCYLSTHRLLNVLDAPLDLIRRFLESERLHFQDVCGRTAWTTTRPPSTELVQIRSLSPSPPPA